MLVFRKRIEKVAAKVGSLLFFFVLLSLPLNAQITEEFTLFFQRDSININPNYLDNKAGLEHIIDYLDRSPRIDSIVIFAYASPEGVYERNVKLSEQRAIAARDFILKQSPEIEKEKIILRPMAENWDGLLEEVQANYFRHDRERIISIIKDDSIKNDTKKWMLRQLNDGISYRYLIIHNMPRLRMATWICVWESPDAGPKTPETLMRIEKLSQIAASIKSVAASLSGTSTSFKSLERLKNVSSELDKIASELNIAARKLEKNPSILDAISKDIDTKAEDLSRLSDEVSIVANEYKKKQQELAQTVAGNASDMEQLAKIANELAQAPSNIQTAPEILVQDAQELALIARQISILDIDPIEETEIEDNVIRLRDTIFDIQPIENEHTIEKERFTIFALKTNLLYDLVTALNAELEIPLGKKFSLMVEDVFPWWTWGPNEKKYAFQMWEVGFEPRWWFYRTDGRDKLSGHFLGLYGMTSKYDFQNDLDLCYQGEYWSAGLTYGFAMPIGKVFNLEFSISAGYLNSDYRHYQPDGGYEHLYRDKYKVGTINYWGPTKLKVSLVLPFTARRVVR